MFRNNWI